MICILVLRRGEEKCYGFKVREKMKMTIGECLNQLPDDMKMIDVLEFNREKKIKTVAEIKATLGKNHLNEEGYEIRDHKTNYGKTIKKAIAQPKTLHLYVEV